jgi:hypothetical protein
MRAGGRQLDSLDRESDPMLDHACDQIEKKVSDRW